MLLLHAHAIVSKPGWGRCQAGRIDRSNNENGESAHTMSVGRVI